MNNGTRWELKTGLAIARMPGLNSIYPADDDLQLDDQIELSAMREERSANANECQKLNCKC